jgi:Asp/Glu/hydantoin racemase
MRILILNPNTSESMMAEIAAAARAAAAPGTEIVAAKPRFGAAEIDSAAGSYLSAVGVMDVVATMVAAGDFDADPAGAVQAIVDEAARAVAEDGADVICLGCAGTAGVTEAISAKLGVPAVDGVRAALALAQALVGLGLTTSKVGALAEGPANPRTYWPISTAPGLTP